MQFILKDGFIHITNNEGLAGSKIEADVVIKYVDNFNNKKFSYSINNSSYRPLKDEKLIINKDEIKNNQIEIKIKAADKETVEVFKSDKMPVTYAVIFGENAENAYPERIRALEKRLDRTHKLIEETVGYIEEVEKRGRLL